MLVETISYQAAQQDSAERFRVEMAQHFTHWADPVAYAWEWKDPPFGSMQCLALQEGKPIGHYGFIGMQFLLRGERVLGAKIEGSYLNPDYTGKRLREAYPSLKGAKIFESLASFGLTEAEKRYDILFGFPNSIATAPQVRAGCELWSIPIKAYSLTNTSIVARIIRKAGRLSPVGARVLAFVRERLHGGPPPSSDVVSAGAIRGVNAAAGLTTIDYNPEYLRWRILENPHSQGFSYVEQGLSGPSAFVIGCVRYLSDGYRVMTINDLKVSRLPGGVQDGVLERLLATAIRDYHPHEIHAWFNRNWLEEFRDAALRSLGFKVEDRELKMLVRSKHPLAAHEEFDINAMWSEGV